MKKQGKNNEKVSKILLNELYDINNLKNDLDEILSIEDITVSESLIQATLKKASETKEENIMPYEEKDTNKKRGIPFRYGMIAACACVLIVAGISLVADQPIRMDKQNDGMSYQEETAADTATEKEDIGPIETTGSESEVSESMNKVPSFFDIVDEDVNSYPIRVEDIEKLIIYDENGRATYNETSDTASSYIESIYDGFANIDIQENIGVVQNEEYKIQYVRQYNIIAHEGVEWSMLNLWITSADQETYIVTREMITSDGETITHQITDVSSDIVMNVMNAVP